MADLVQMRRLWPLVARRLVDEGWSEADLLEARAALAEAVAAKDEPVLAAWLVWLEAHFSRPPRRCGTCADFFQPCGTNGFCGGGRGDLPFAFSAGHPLRRLPDDGGVSCDLWRVA